MRELHIHASRAGKRRRQATLLRIIDTRPIGTQDELAAALADEGIETTQASLSRDLRELGVAKQGGRYRHLGAAVAAPAEPGLTDALRLFLRGTAPVPPNLVIVKTREGAAPEVASLLDGAGWAEVAGTVAGDDTIFVAVRDAAAARRVIARLHELSGRRSA